MTKRGLGRDQVHDAAWGHESYPHPLVSCLMPVFVFCLLIGLGFVGLTIWQQSLPGTVTIPEITGLSVEEASARLRHAGLRVDALDEQKPSETVPAGSVISISPTEGRSVKVGRTIRLLLSSGSQYVKVPNVVNVTQETAHETLTSAGLRITLEQYMYDEKMPIDRILGISPKPGTKVIRGSAVSLTISKGSKEEERAILGDDPLRSSVLSVDIPEEEKAPAEARIVVIDDEGQHVVYREMHNPGDSLVYTVNGIGDTTVKVFFGERLLLTRKL